jgi:DNA-binding transcriptional LysR family regulator
MNHLRILRYIDEIARVGSIRQAAENLHVAASAVNRRLLDVEEELGAQLFERLPRGMRLTSAGDLFVHYIRSRAADLEQVRSEIAELQGLRRGHVSILSSQALAPAFLPQVVASFRVKHPDVTLQVRFGDHLQALAALRAFEIEFALVFNLAPDADIERIAEFDQKLVVIMHRSHPLAKREGGLRLRDCANHAMALPNRDTAGRRMLEGFLARSSQKLKPVVESTGFEFLRGYLRYEKAISFQFEIGAESVGGEFVAREIEDRGFPRGKLVLAQLRGRQLPVMSHTFAEHVIHAMNNSYSRA